MCSPVRTEKSGIVRGDTHRSRLFELIELLTDNIVDRSQRIRYVCSVTRSYERFSVSYYQN